MSLHVLVISVLGIAKTRSHLRRGRHALAQSVSTQPYEAPLVRLPVFQRAGMAAHYILALVGIR